MNNSLIMQACCPFFVSCRISAASTEPCSCAQAADPFRASGEDSPRKETSSGARQRTVPCLTITEGYLMVEVLTAGNRFCLSFETLCDTERYLDEFLNVLREEGVPYTVGETEQSNLPRIELRS